MSKLACLSAVESSPPAHQPSEHIHARLAVDVQGLRFSPAADHHNEIPRLDSYGHIKQALTGVMLCL